MENAPAIQLALFPAEQGKRFSKRTARDLARAVQYSPK